MKIQRFRSKQVYLKKIHQKLLLIDPLCRIHLRKYLRFYILVLKYNLFQKRFRSRL